jgi:hypothetical protein
MRRINSSHASLGISALALFVALGGTAVAVSRSAVTTQKLADNAVTSAKVANGSLTAQDIAPNTFLAASGTAADSTKLGGLPANQYVQGRGAMVFRRVSLPAGSARSRSSASASATFRAHVTRGVCRRFATSPMSTASTWRLGLELRRHNEPDNYQGTHERRVLRGAAVDHRPPERHPGRRRITMECSITSRPPGRPVRTSERRAASSSDRASRPDRRAPSTSFSSTRIET